MTQFNQIGAKRQRRLAKIVKKHPKKELLTLEKVKQMRDTPLNLQTFQRNARRYYSTHFVGSQLVLSHPYTDVHGRHLTTVMLDFSQYKTSSYVYVQPFLRSLDFTYGLIVSGYTYWLHVKSHRELYKKLIEHHLL